MLGIVKKVGRRSNISSNACAWKQQKWEHHYVQSPCEKHSQETCLDWGKNTIFDVFTKIKLRCCLQFNGIDHICIIGTEVIKNGKRQNTLSCLVFFFLKAKLQNKPTSVMDPRAGSMTPTWHFSHCSAPKGFFHYQNQQAGRETRVLVEEHRHRSCL